MTDESIKEILEKQYNKSRAMIYFLFFASFAILVMPIYYEYTISFMHVTSLVNHLSLASAYIILIWLSGLCFGAALYWRRVLKKIVKVF